MHSPASSLTLGLPPQMVGEWICAVLSQRFTVICSSRNTYTPDSCRPVPSSPLPVPSCGLPLPPREARASSLQVSPRLPLTGSPSGLLRPPLEEMVLLLVLETGPCPTPGSRRSHQPEDPALPQGGPHGPAKPNKSCPRVLFKSWVNEGQWVCWLWLSHEEDRGLQWQRMAVTFRGK